MAVAWIAYQKIFGTEIFWMAILLLPIRTDRVQARPEPERWSCPWRRHRFAIKNFRGGTFLDGDSADSYKTDLAQERPKPERWACPWRRHGLAIKKFRDRQVLDGVSVDSYKN